MFKPNKKLVCNTPKLWKLDIPSNFQMQWKDIWMKRQP